MTKEEKIKQAWAETGVTIVSSELSSLGFIDRDRNVLAGEIDPELFDIRFFSYIRPKSLRGIEDNNGWIKMSEKEPERGEQYWVIDEWGYIEIRQYVISRGSWKDVTHYRPIEKPEPPLY